MKEEKKNPHLLLRVCIFCCFFFALFCSRSSSHAAVLLSVNVYSLIFLPLISHPHLVRFPPPQHTHHRHSITARHTVHTHMTFYPFTLFLYFTIHFFSLFCLGFFCTNENHWHCVVSCVYFPFASPHNHTYEY